MIDMRKEELKRQIVDKTTKLAYESVRTKGIGILQAVDEAIKETCFRLGISEQERKKLFV